MSSQADVDSFAIALPPDWVRFPLEAGDFEDFVRGQRDRLRREGNLSRVAERQFEVLMRSLRNDCDSAGIRMIATLFGLVGTDEETTDGEPADGAPEEATEASQQEAATESELMAASVTISVATRAEMGSDLPLTVNTVYLAMSSDRPHDDSNQTDRASVSNLEPPSIVTMPVGEVVKVVRLHRLKRPESRAGTELNREVPVFVQHFFVPIDDLGSSAAIVTFTSPTVSLARPMSDLFDAMMSTFEMFSGDDITDPVRSDDTSS